MRFKLIGAQTQLNRHFRINIKPLFWQPGNDRIPVEECFIHFVSVDLPLNQVIRNVRRHIVEDVVTEKGFCSNFCIEGLIVIDNDQFPLAGLPEQIRITTGNSG